jgi:glycosyltransferase involved in cell wall biosynthesis
MKNIIFICHSNYSNNIVSDANYGITFEFLDHFFKDQYSTIRHSLYKNGESRLYKDGIDSAYRRVPMVGKLPDPIRYVVEAFVSGAMLIRYRPKTVLAIDPLSALPAVVLKKMGFLKRVYFITPDFSEVRFENRYLNAAYFFIDKFCTKNSTKNICCSKFVIEYKMKRYGLDDSYFFHMPNLPNPWIVEEIEKKNIQKNEKQIIYVGNLSGQIDFEDILTSFNTLKMEHPELRLVILGKGDAEAHIKETISKLGVQDVDLKGQLSFRETLEEVAGSGIGIATYNGSFNYDVFRDSCKIREYQSLNTIPLTNKTVVSNAEEIQRFGSGFIMEDRGSMYDAFRAIINDSETRKNMLEGMKRNGDFYKNKYEEYKNLIG